MTLCDVRGGRTSLHFWCGLSSVWSLESQVIGRVWLVFWLRRQKGWAGNLDRRSCQQLSDLAAFCMCFSVALLMTGGLTWWCCVMSQAAVPCTVCRLQRILPLVLARGVDGVSGWHPGTGGLGSCSSLGMTSRGLWDVQEATQPCCQKHTWTGADLLPTGFIRQAQHFTVSQ